MPAVGTIAPDDVNLFTVVDSAEEGWSVVREYYNLPEVGLESWESLARERENVEIDRYAALLAADMDDTTRTMITSFLDAERNHAESLGGKWMDA